MRKNPCSSHIGISRRLHRLRAHSSVFAQIVKTFETIADYALNRIAGSIHWVEDSAGNSGPRRHRHQ
jgi:hypothetical protein